MPLVADLQGSLTAELIDHGSFGHDDAMAAVTRDVERWLVHRPDHIVTSSTHGVALLTAQGVDPARVSVLPDGVDLNAFRPQPPDPTLVSQLGLERKRVVVFLGVLTAYQGVDLLLDVAPIVAQAQPDVHFLIVGYPNEERYRQLVRERGLDQVVSVPGRIPYAEAARWLCLGEVAVSLKRSLTEANGKLLNYMACGLPVVATETPVNRELLGDDGAYAPVDDADATAVRILELLADRDRGRAVGGALRRRAERLFARPVLTARLADIYRKTLAEAR